MIHWLAPLVALMREHRQRGFPKCGHPLHPERGGHRRGGPALALALTTTVCWAACSCAYVTGQVIGSTLLWVAGHQALNWERTP